MYIDFFEKNCHESLNTREKTVIEKAIGYQLFGEVDKNIQLSLRGYPSKIRKNIHHSKEVERMNAKGQYVIKKLFEAYSSHPQQLPNNVIKGYLRDI